MPTTENAELPIETADETDPFLVGYQAGVAAERDRCATVAESYWRNPHHNYASVYDAIAAAIRNKE